MKQILILRAAKVSTDPYVTCNRCHGFPGSAVPQGSTRAKTYRLPFQSVTVLIVPQRTLKIWVASGVLLMTPGRDG